MRTLLPLAFSGLALAGCGSRQLPQPAMGQHTVPVEKWTEIETPPAPVEAEEVGPRPGPDFVWIDGQWDYQPLAKRWTWEPGRWCVPPPNSVYYAPAQALRFRKVIGRVVRWNEPLQRFEEVDSRDDRWHWIRGQFYAHAPDGTVQPSTQQPLCKRHVGFDGDGP